MIRQAISCDICGAEKRQTNHWFVVYEQSGELRVSGWSSRYRLRPSSKHLCGQTCVHKLADEFMAQSIAVGAERRGEAVEAEAGSAAPADTGVAIASENRADENGAAAAEEAAQFESSARLITAPASPKPAHRHQPELVTTPPHPLPQDLPPLPADTLRYASRRWQTEAWERERELGAAEDRPDIAARRRTSA